MMQQKNMDINMIPLSEILMMIPLDWDIDKPDISKELDNSLEAIAYRKIRSIANANEFDVKWDVAIKELTNSVLLIWNLIQDKKLKHPEELKEFTENSITIMESWDKIYRTAFNDIKAFRESYKAPKSIDEMNVDELREYIKKHNIK